MMKWETIKAKIDVSRTSEKFQNMKNEVLSFLITNLLSLNELETEYLKKYEDLSADKQNLEIPFYQTHPKEDELWKEYHQRCEKIARSIYIKEFKSYKRSLGRPAEYDCLNYDNTEILFIMKSASRAVVEIYFFEQSIEKKNQFVLKKIADSWKIDKKYYGFQRDSKWSADPRI